MNSQKKIGSGFSYNEAKDMLALAISADLFAPYGYGVAWKNFETKQLPPERNPCNPIPPGVEANYPYPEKPLWPDGWTPGVESNDDNVWIPSIIASTIPGFNEGDPPIKANAALFTYNEELDAYCIAFAGTVNMPTTMQDILYTPTNAGPTDILENSEAYHYFSETTYITNWKIDSNYSQKIPKCSHILKNKELFDQPPSVVPMVSLGIRFGLETLTVKADEKNSLVKLLKSTGRKEINLFITGHSLGAGLASLFAAWLQAGNIPGIKFNIKTYSYAPEKLGNLAFIDNFNIGLTNQGMHFVIKNNLDICAQLPLTIGKKHDLVNPKGTLTWMPYTTQVLLAEYANLLGISDDNNEEGCKNTNYFHPGWVITLNGNYPVIYDKEYYPEVFTQNSNEPVPIESPRSDDFEIAFLRIWWQHMPWNYRLYLDNLFNLQSG